MGRLGLLPKGLRRAFRQLRETLRMIQFEHTIFALPFALTGAVLAVRGLPATDQLGWILLAMVGARSAAMTFNRLADQPYDARNPRTAGRPLITGALSRRFAWSFLLAASILFVYSAFRLNRLAFILSFPVLALLLAYSYAKRFTSAAHFLLGACLGCAPLGAWIAVRGDIGTAPLILGLAVLLWTAGFDIIYACQDLEFDRGVGLHSIPRLLGVGRALMLSRLLHLAMLAALFLVGRTLRLGLLYNLGVLGTAALLAYEHSLVRADDLSRVNRAFFTINGYISIFLLLTTLADVHWPL
jgi:4-hydroxybenzoate polyprenyltransferase